MGYSTMGVRSRSRSKRRRSATLSVGDGGVGGDLISSLPDDLLVRILDLLPDTRDVVRTHALSRRWRGLWTGVPALRFNSVRWPAVRMEAGAGEQYLAFADDALMLRAKATRRRCAVKDLVISLNIMSQKTEELVPRSFQAAQGWIRYAVQHEVKSLILKLELPWIYEDRLAQGGHEHPVMAIDELATYAKLDTMHLRLGFAQLELSFSSSSMVVFTSLTDLSLEDTTVAGHLLSRLVSSPCCPRLRKLRLDHLHLSTTGDLLLEASVLLELSLDKIENMQSLELRTPSLRVLHVVHCYDLEVFTVSAPRIDDLMFWAQQPLRIDDINQMSGSVS
ncbi:putative FBD-associated F-box protein At5g56400 [Miscanthus floridulus]|uniref:putative FBD-associated F-box protein At5g56400 n=1 Tax=Miscanthus floridulus TaxID=154761 RepID=UPI003458B056